MTRRATSFAASRQRRRSGPSIGLEGAVAADGTYTAPAGGSAGLVKATVGEVTGQARVRVIPPLPLSYDFTGAKAPMPWWTANAKTNIFDARRRVGAAAARATTPSAGVRA